ncbi:MAG: AAA family ATPase [Desulfobaccales bacterium]
MAGLVVIFGLMGAGKSTLARALGQARGWPVIESDRVRKALAGLAPGDRAETDFGQGIYAEDFSARTYAEMLRLAAAHLAEGSGVILDGSFKRAGDRERARQLAREHRVPVVFVYCACPPEEARRRLGIRRADLQAVSDGRVELFEAQTRDFDPPGPEDRPLLRLNTDRELPAVVEDLKGFVKRYLD